MLTIDFNKLELHPDDRVLDIGCGEGRHTIKASQHKHTKCIGADFNYKPLADTKNKIAFHKSINDLNCKSVDLSCMDVTALPFEDSRFDLVICSEVLEHIPDDNKALYEITRVLKPGKTLAVSVPRFFPEKICWLLSREYTRTEGGHIRIYKKKPLVQFIESFGLTFFDSNYAHSLHTPFWWLKCIVGLNRNDFFAVSLYHRFLVWDLMKQPMLTRWIDSLLNPVIGKSLVLYFKKT